MDYVPYCPACADCKIKMKTKWLCAVSGQECTPSKQAVRRKHARWYREEGARLDPNEKPHGEAKQSIAYMLPQTHSRGGFVDDDTKLHDGFTRFGFEPGERESNGGDRPYNMSKEI